MKQIKYKNNLILNTQINYLVQWSKDKKKSWSGTHYSLLKALEKITYVKEISLKLNFFQKLILVLEKVLLKIFKIEQFGRLHFLFLEN